MIAYVKGELAYVQEDSVVIDVHGVGYRIYISPKTFNSLPPRGNEVLLHTYMNVKEDLMQLYGFLSREDLILFKMIISVSGIGPKGGLSILSVLSTEELQYAILTGDSKAIASAPGIGKKTAEKLIIELKDKLKIEDVAAPGVNGTSPDDTAGESLDKEAVLALTSLGYSNAEAIRAVRKVAVTENSTVEEILKQALKQV